MNPRRLRQWKVFVISMFTLLFVAEVGAVIRQERNQVFAATAQRVGSALVDFALERAYLLKRETNESFKQYEKRISIENAETQALYSKQYSVEVARLRDGFARRGLETPEMNEFYRRPGSAIAIREIGRALFDMGVELGSENVSFVVKSWVRRLIRIVRR